MSSHPSHPTNTKTLSPPLPKIHVSLSVGSSDWKYIFTDTVVPLYIAVNPEDEMDVFFRQHPRKLCTSSNCYGYEKISK
ncbi:Protein CBG12104 [Caenorhabditis briggsae]|uniref:Protein CBG12104 n=1 Tax=Caenorhabditis briggsae TaxID=6238 RepID=A8XER8_CAEBR|nr:Protein CBG12104 [Caenorhabditis briggsae]CAP31140.1 Protein CBG12104 [Caenorhabditis briggsae]